MKRLLIAPLLILLSGAAAAHEVKVGNLAIVHPWARATAGAAKNGAVYMRIENQGDTDDRLIAMTTAAAARVEMHTHIEENGTAMMRLVEAIDLPAHGVTEFKPGHYHVMLIGVDPPLREFDTFVMTLEFATAGKIDVEVYVEAAGATEPMH
jgi:copper(I)-binding protein